MGAKRSAEECKVAVVIGNVVKIYGPSNNGFRPYTGDKRTFSNRGQAQFYAQEFDDLQQGRD